MSVILILCPLLSMLSSGNRYRRPRASRFSRTRTSPSVHTERRGAFASPLHPRVASAPLFEYAVPVVLNGNRSHHNRHLALYRRRLVFGADSETAQATPHHRLPW